MKTKSIALRAQRVCRRLRNGSHVQGRIPLWQVRYHFALLVILIERLSPSLVDSSDLGYLRNRAASSRRLWEDGHVGAARYQLLEMENKLRTRAATESSEESEG